MELRTFLGSKPESLSLSDMEAGTDPVLTLETPMLFSAMSYGAISYNAFQALAIAASRSGTFFNTGEGGMPAEMRSQFKEHTIVQVASGRFGIDAEYLNSGAAVEIKIGQGAKPGIGGHLPGEKVCRMKAWGVSLSLPLGRRQRTSDSQRICSCRISSYPVRHRMCAPRRSTGARTPCIYRSCHFWI